MEELPITRDHDVVNELIPKQGENLPNNPNDNNKPYKGVKRVRLNINVNEDGEDEDQEYSYVNVNVNDISENYKNVSENQIDMGEDFDFENGVVSVSTIRYKTTGLIEKSVYDAVMDKIQDSTVEKSLKSVVEGFDPSTETNVIGPSENGKLLIPSVTVKNNEYLIPNVKVKVSTVGNNETPSAMEYTKGVNTYSPVADKIVNIDNIKVDTSEIEVGTNEVFNNPEVVIDENNLMNFATSNGYNITPNYNVVDGQNTAMRNVNIKARSLVKQSDFQTVADENDTLTQENRDLTTTNTQLTTQNQQLQQSNSELTQSNNTLLSENTELSTENNALKNTNQLLNSEVTELTTINNNLNTQNQQLSNQVSTLNQEKQQLITNNNELVSDINNINRRTNPDYRMDLVNSIDRVVGEGDNIDRYIEDFGEIPSRGIRAVVPDNHYNRTSKITYNSNGLIRKDRLVSDLPLNVLDATTIIDNQRYPIIDTGFAGVSNEYFKIELQTLPNGTITINGEPYVQLGARDISLCVNGLLLLSDRNENREVTLDSIISYFENNISQNNLIIDNHNQPNDHYTSSNGFKIIKGNINYIKGNLYVNGDDGLLRIDYANLTNTQTEVGDSTMFIWDINNYNDKVSENEAIVGIRGLKCYFGVQELNYTTVVDKMEEGYLKENYSLDFDISPLAKEIIIGYDKVKIIQPTWRKRRLKIKSNNITSSLPIDNNPYKHIRINPLSNNNAMEEEEESKDIIMRNAIDDSSNNNSLCTTYYFDDLNDIADYNVDNNTNYLQFLATQNIVEFELLDYITIDITNNTQSGSPFVFNINEWINNLILNPDNKNPIGMKEVRINVNVPSGSNYSNISNIDLDNINYVASNPNINPSVRGLLRDGTSDYYLKLTLTPEQVQNGYNGFNNNLIIPLNNLFDSSNVIINTELVEDPNDEDNMIEVIKFNIDEVYDDPVVAEQSLELVNNYNINSNGSFSIVDYNNNNGTHYYGFKNIIVNVPDTSVNNYLYPIITTSGNYSIPSGYTGIGDFIVDIPQNLVDNADVNNDNIIKSNGNYIIPNGKTGFNSFDVDVELNTTHQTVTIDTIGNNITTVYNPNNYNESFIYNMTSNNSNGFIITNVVGPIYNGNFDAWRLFDNNLNANGSFSSARNVGYLSCVVQVPIPKKLQRFWFRYNASNTWFIQEYHFYGSNDNITFTEIFGETGLVSHNGYWEIQKSTGSNIAYSYFKFEFIKIDDINSGVSIEINELRVYEDNINTGFDKFTIINNTQNAMNNLIESQRTVNIYDNGTITISPVSGKSALASVKINTNVTPSYPEIITEQIKTVEINSNGQTIILPSNGNDAMEQVNVNVNVNGNIQNNKFVLLQENGVFTITPDQGYDSISSITIDNNVINSVNNAVIQNEKIVNIEDNGTIDINPDNGYNLLKKVKVNTSIQPNLVDLNETVSVPGNYEYNTPENCDGIRKINISFSNIQYYDITKFYYIVVNDQGYNNSYNEDNSYYLGNFPPVDDTIVTNLIFNDPSQSLNKPNANMLILLKNDNNMLRFFTCFNNASNTSATGGAYYTLIPNIASNKWYYIYYKIEDNNYMPLFYIRSVREGGNLTMIGTNIPNAQLYIPLNDEIEI